MFSCGSELETISYFLLRCQNHIVSRTKLFKNLYNLDQLINYPLYFGLQYSLTINLSESYKKLAP